MRTALVLLAVLALAGCSTEPSADPPSAPDAPPPPAPEQLRVQVLDELPHDPGAFTQGLEIAGDTLYEGTGKRGQSQLRSGPVGGPPTTNAALPPDLFGEGITVTGPSVWQLTWTEGVAIERDPVTLAERRRVPYEGQGWGLCHQRGADRLVMSDGTGRLSFRDPRTFAPLGEVRVVSANGKVNSLNELECVGDTVYANVWQKDEILRIDPAAGVVTGEIDAAGLLRPEAEAGADVLNGIAAVPGTDQFLLTGKLWPTMFRTTLVPAA